MIKYDDEQLSPQKFADMAKEFSLQKYAQKNDFEVDKEVSIICDCIIFFKNLNLPKNQKQNLYSLTQIELPQKFCNTKPRFLNYCNCLNICIQSCASAIKKITTYCDFCINEENKILVSKLLDVISICTNMYGTCKWRKI